MGKLKALLLTEGMHGMISQVEGLAKALNTEFYHKIVRLSFPWKFIPPKFTPISNIILKDQIYINESIYPNLIISCGRKSVIPSILLKKKNENIFTIHIQDPKVNLDKFDLVIAPEHDGLEGRNVLNSKGSIHYITEKDIEKAKPYLQNKIKDKKVTALILGGPNKYYKFSNSELIKIFKVVKLNFISKGYYLVVIPSIRTPQNIIDLAIKEFALNSFVVRSVDKQAYLSALGIATNIIVTSDSTSMISEAAFSGKPIYVAHMKPIKNNYRFKRFFSLFSDLGIIKNLGENIESWSYTKLNETDRLAKMVLKKIKI